MSEHETMEDLARAAGFASEQELTRMVVAVDLTRSGALYFFDRWKRDDGTKAGLMANFPETAHAQDRARDLRESIASNVEGLGCMAEGHRGVGGISVCTADPPDHHWSCPVTIAAAIREGRL